MWILVRANALGASESKNERSKVLAACPDSGERGDPWRWTVTLDESSVGLDVGVEADRDFISVSTTRVQNEPATVFSRSGGDQLVIAALEGETLVSAENGPWKRWLRPGDVFIIEGEETEKVSLFMADTDTSVEAISLSPTKAPALRWVP